MQKIIHGLPVVVVITALIMIGHYIIEERKAKKPPEPGVVVAEKVAAENLPVSETLPEADRQLVARVFNAPEELDAATAVPAARPAEKTAVTEKPNAATVASTASPQAEKAPALLSEVEPSTQSKTPVSADWKPAFQKDFESLRTEAVRNPDSAQNRATVNTLMQKRQQRLAREGR